MQRKKDYGLVFLLFFCGLIGVHSLYDLHYFVLLKTAFTVSGGMNTVHNVPEILRLWQSQLMVAYNLERHFHQSALFIDYL